MCEQHTIYDPSLKKCDSIKHYNLLNFCSDRSTTNWQNPWNCHGYIACVYQRSYPMKCAEPELIYNPESDRCVNAGIIPCREEKKDNKSQSMLIPQEFKSNVANPCDAKSDGKYATRDIYEYLVCKNHIASYVPCVRQIFDPSSKICVDYSKVDKQTFCKIRQNGNYNDPWNCHEFITCSNHYLYFFNCQTSDLVYDPVSNRCKHPEEAICKQVNGK